MVRWLSSFLGVWLCVSALAAQRLPVRIDTLYAQDYGGAPMVYWQAGEEFDAAFFVVERSADLRRWESLQTVPIATLMERRDKSAPYRHWDRAAPALRPLWYRLRVVREIGVYDYTHPACVYGENAPALWADAFLSPEGALIVHAAQAGRYALKISTPSADNQAIMQDSVQLREGVNFLPVEGLPSGLLLLQIERWRYLLSID